MNEIGEKLKKARQAKGYTLDDLQQITKIQKRYLTAVEEGNHEVLPGSFYTRAFIKQYADSVGLNGEELINEHTEALPQASEKPYQDNVPNTQTRSKPKSSGFLATVQDSLPTILIVVLVIAIVTAIYFAISSGGDNNGTDSFIQGDDSSEVVEVEENNDENEESQESSETGEDEEEPQSNEDEEEQEAEAETDGQQAEEIDGSANSTTYTVSGQHPQDQMITLTAENGSSWVSIEIDGQPISQATLNDGESLEAEFDESVSRIDLVIGNSPVTSVELNGEDLPFSEASEGAVRKVMEINFD
ncbi:Transcriptional regulator in cluster with unspecified monosaccharide ABC transport system [Alkalibacterium sp. AK22]|uniref:helix-turn-helix domain-containing protein n=1 Tax=Alkalibacterium sp. AK22 TaxID=1229520 RepID=UPI00044DB234|nr:helix-turn-helix domain-containing protein [Alkalibacterium sp. AK22]EXJ22687.1 Transcriptional regulator in cluster with unspecified monosaccharide ABC transport system [Alkalibacterium sp. AK22]